VHQGETLAEALRFAAESPLVERQSTIVSASRSIG
jgi:hypothetical protein